MTKSEFIEIVAERMDIPKSQAYDVVTAVFGAMTEALLEERRIELRGFGSFSIREYESRLGRNPKTGEKVRVDSKKSVHFKVGKELRERVDVLNNYN